MITRAFGWAKDNKEPIIEWVKVAIIGGALLGLAIVTLAYGGDYA